MRRSKLNPLFSIALLLICSSVCWAAEPNTVEADGPIPQPGKEIEFVFEDHNIVVYLPLDYNDINTAPVIFYYHGQGGQPSTSFFQHVTGSKGFVIVGMSYANELEGTVRRGRYINYVKGEVSRLGRLKRYLQSQLHLKIDDRKLLVTGISKGGWFADDLFEYRPQPWAGAVIIAAGRRGLVELAKGTSLKGKCVYIGAGQKDPNLHAAKRARGFLRRAGAKVTFEIYEGLGHAAKSDSVILQKWLTDMAKITEADS